MFVFVGVAFVVITKNIPTRYVFSYGGRWGIRTPAGGKAPAGFQDQSLQPDLGNRPYVLNVLLLYYIQNERKLIYCIKNIYANVNLPRQSSTKVDLSPWSIVVNVVVYSIYPTFVPSVG